MPDPIRDQKPHPLRNCPRDLVAAFGLLTRIPVPFTAPRPEGVWAWPLVGAVTAGLALALGAAVQAAGVSVGVAAALVIAVQAALTGGLHEDGLADCADGFWGSHDRARRLEIMKDSRIGSYGALALMLVMLMRWSALAACLSAGAWGLALVPALLARAMMGLTMAALPNARRGGLSDGHGRPPMLAAALGLALALGLGAVLAGAAILGLTAAAAGVTLGLAQVARAKIGGQTGDVLGATEVLAEVAALAAASAILA